MNNALTPSKVLEEYDIVGAKIPKSLMTEMREKFASLEMEDVGIWKILCDEVADINVEQKVDQQKLYVAQACAEVLSEKISRLEYTDGLGWRNRIDQLETKEDFHALFSVLGILDDKWQSSIWLQKNNFAQVYVSIRDKFSNWKNFLDFMNIHDKEQSGYWTRLIADYKNPQSYLDLFTQFGYKDEEWKSSKKLDRMGHSGLKRAICIKHNKWNGFLDFMGKPKEGRMGYWTDVVSQIETTGGFLHLFASKKIINWHISNVLKNNGYSGLYSAIVGKFGSWTAFLNFMNRDASQQKGFWKKEYAKCKSPKDIKELFKRNNIPHAALGNSTILLEKWSPLYNAIMDEYETFDDFRIYVDFLPIEKKDYWIKQFEECASIESILKLIESAGYIITLDTSGEKIRNKCRGLHRAICTYFGSWDSFLRLIKDSSIQEDEELDKISGISLEDSIALLAEKDPHKLKLYIQFAHPELAEEEVDTLVIRAFKNFVAGRSETREAKYLEYPISLPSVTVDPPEETDEASIILEGKATGEFVYITGVYPRKVRIIDGAFSVSIPLKQGETNEIRILGVDTTDPKNNHRSDQRTVYIQQTSEEQDDVAVLFALLDSHSVSLRRDIQKNPGRAEYLQQCAEQVLIKKFSRSFEEGEEYVEDLLQKTESPSVIKVLKNVLKKFKKVHSATLKNVQAGSLMFFQKYCAYEIQRRMQDENCPGVILANDPGLGKTRTIEAAIADREAGIICPNAVVSAWEEEANIVLKNPDMLVMRDIPHAIRKEMLRTRKQIANTISPRRYVTNTKFLQNTKDTERFELLGGRDMVIVHDEAHSRINEHSEQSKGARMIEHQFQINVTATPAKSPEAARRLLRTLYPEDKRFQSAAAFKKVFPANDPQALKTLSLLLQKDMIRFRKQDVLELIDPEQSLLQQKHKLPRKEYIDSDTSGAFTISEKQATAIYEMFLNWHKWTKKYDKYIPNDDTAEDDRLRVAGSLAKRHALRQSINNPQYLGMKGVDSKAQQAKRIVNDCLQRGRKVVIFCAYNAQAQKYAEMFKQHNPALYTGDTSNEGDYKNDTGDSMRFQRESGNHKKKKGWKFDADGYPIEDPQGDTMSALDYERHTFQNTEDRKINIVTYKAGAVGTTFTAGKAMIFDDLPTDVIEAIQAEDRIQRIDPDRQSHATVEYYNLISRYPKKFLSRMKKVWVVRDKTTQSYKEYKTKDAAERFANAQTKKLGHDAEIDIDTAFNMFFDQGTYDEVHIQNLVTQRHMFHLINDGIADAAILHEDQIQFKGFENGDNAAEVE